MRTYLMVMLTAASVSFADIILPDVNLTFTNTQVKAQIVTNTVVAKDVKVVLTGFSINYMPPAYTTAVYAVTYHIQDAASNKEIRGTTRTVRLSQKQVEDKAAVYGMDFSSQSMGIGILLNRFLMETLTGE